jgi:hypothetical protein
MSDFFRRLAGRAQGLVPMLAPRLPGRFEPEDWLPGEAAPPAVDFPVSTSGAPIPGSGRGPEVPSGTSSSAVAWPPAALPSEPPSPATAAAPAAPRLPAGEVLRPVSRPVLPAGQSPPAPAAPAPAPTGPSGRVRGGDATPAESLRRSGDASPTPRARARRGSEARSSPAEVPAASARVVRRTENSLSSPAAAPLAAPAVTSPVVFADPPADRRPAPARPVADSTAPPGPAGVATAAGDSSLLPQQAVPAAPPAPPAAAEAAPGAPAPVEITIGRVEIRFPPPAPPPAAPAPSRAVGPPPLDDLLARGPRR